MDRKKAKKAAEAARARKSGKAPRAMTAKQRRNLEAEEAAERVVVELLRSRVETEEAHNEEVGWFCLRWIHG